MNTIAMGEVAAEDTIKGLIMEVEGIMKEADMEREIQAAATVSSLMPLIRQ